MSDRRAKVKRAEKKIKGLVERGVAVNIGKVSTSTVETVSRSKTHKQRGEAKGELLKRAVSGTYR